MGAAKVLIIDDQDRYLLLVRANHPRFGDDPDLPGGTIEAGESPEIAAVREVEEEAGVIIPPDNLKLLYSGRGYSRHDIKYTLFLTKVSSRPKVVVSWEHASYVWLSKEKFLETVKGAADSYMKMVYDVVSKDGNDL